MKIRLGELKALLREAAGLASCDNCDSTDDVKSSGRDAEGEPDGPDLCVHCREELAAGDSYDRATGLSRPMAPVAHRGY